MKGTLLKLLNVNTVSIPILSRPKNICFPFKEYGQYKQQISKIYNFIISIGMKETAASQDAITEGKKKKKFPCWLILIPYLCYCCILGTILKRNHGDNVHSWFFKMQPLRLFEDELTTVTIFSGYLHCTFTSSSG